MYIPPNRMKPWSKQDYNTFLQIRLVGHQGVWTTLRRPLQLQIQWIYHVFWSHLTRQICRLSWGAPRTLQGRQRAAHFLLQEGLATPSVLHNCIQGNDLFLQRFIITWSALLCAPGQDTLKERVYPVLWCTKDRHRLRFPDPLHNETHVSWPWIYDFLLRVYKTPDTDLRTFFPTRSGKRFSQRTEKH
jgi:hypothetical protein